MSQLDQAKKEAKRLFNLAKSSPGSQITIPNLSSSRELMAHINGYQDWHEYEEVLKKKDFLYGQTDKNQIHRDHKENAALAKSRYYIQDIEFNHIEYQKNPISVIVKKEHTPIVLGVQKDTKIFDKKKSWLLNSYPAMVLGTVGAGKTDTLLSISKSYLEHKEGLIYFDGKSEPMIYTKMFSYLKTLDRLGDLYCINFMTGARDVFDPKEKNLSHSIDPINPMLGNTEYFKKFFGSEFGTVLHAILTHVHQKNCLMDIQSLEATMMLNNLIEWAGDKFKHVSEIQDYLNFLNIPADYVTDDYSHSDLEESLKKHAFYCETAYKTLCIFKNHPHAFQVDCSVDMEEIFLQRKILLVLLPALEKNPNDAAIPGELILAQVVHVENKMKNYQIHTQNIIIDEFRYYGGELEKINFSETCNNYIFGAQDLYPHNHPLINSLVFNTQTFVYMKMEDPKGVANRIKIDIFDHFQNLSIKGFKKGMQLSDLHLYLREQNMGDAFIFCHNKNKKDDHATHSYINSDAKYYIAPITCCYHAAPRVKNAYLVEQIKKYNFKT